MVSCCNFLIGAGIFDENSESSLPNNGIIAVSDYDQLNISCWFSAKTYYKAQFIGLDGTKVHSASGPFDVKSNHSTMMRITTSSSLSESDQGVYTCRANGEAGSTELNIGVFRTAFYREYTFC